MKKVRILMIAAALVLAYAASAHAQEVTASLTRASVKRGHKVSGKIVLTIPKGLHVNSNKPSSPYLIATRAVITGGKLRVSGPRYPAGHDRKFGFSEEPINVYEGTVTFPFTLRATTRHRKGDVNVRVKVLYQACTEEVCYAPKNKTIFLKLRVL